MSFVLLLSFIAYKWTKLITKDENVHLFGNIFRFFMHVYVQFIYVYALFVSVLIKSYVYSYVTEECVASGECYNCEFDHEMAVCSFRPGL